MSLGLLKNPSQSSAIAGSLSSRLNSPTKRSTLASLKETYLRTADDLISTVGPSKASSLPATLLFRWLSITCLLIITFVFLFISHTTVSPWSLFKKAPLKKTRACNPYDDGGYLHWDPANPRTAQWTTFDSSCPPAPEYFALSAKAHSDDAGAQDPYTAAYEERIAAVTSLSFMRKKTVLLLGDSVDRNALFQMGDVMKAGLWPSAYNNASRVGAEEGWDPRGSPHVLDSWQNSLRIYNGFMYGMDDLDAFKHQVDWHAPGKAEDRLEQLFAPFINSSGRHPDLISIHSGMWDLALWGRRDAELGISTATPLSKERMEWWAKRMRSFISAVQEKWPNTPIWLRTSHRVGLLQTTASTDYIVGAKVDLAKLPNFFTDLRSRQLQEMQRSLARELCLPILDFARTWEGYQQFQDKVHPLELPGAFAYGLPLFHALYLESLGRENWLNRPCNVKI